MTELPEGATYTRLPEEQRPPPTVDEARVQLQAALAEAQGEFPAISREKSVTVKTRDGSSYSYSYADLATILAAVRPVLAKHGLAIIQPLESPAGVPSVRTEILHAAGGRIAAAFPLGALPDSPQQRGSLITYVRRYALISMLALAAEDDDDGRTASAHSAGGAERTEAEPSQFQPPSNLSDQASAESLSDAQRKKIYALKTKLTKAELVDDEKWAAVLGGEFGTESVTELTKTQASKLIEWLVVKEKEIPSP
jgi:hypothetical protein